MAALSDEYDIGRLRLTSGESRSVELFTGVDLFELGADRYEVAPDPVGFRLDIDRTTGYGYALRLRFSAALHGPCMRCLEPAEPSFEVDIREIDQPGGGEELTSPYLADGILDVHSWVREALSLALPSQVLCRPACAGLCTQCGVNLNADPEHAHPAPPDPRWAKLSELDLNVDGDD